MGSRGKIEGVSKVVRGKWKRWKGVFSFTFQWPLNMEHSNGHQTWNIPMATKHGIFQWPPSMEHSNGHQTWNIPMATKHGIFHWPPSQEPSPSPSIGHQAKELHPLFKRRTWILGRILFPPKKQFQFNLESVCCDKFLEEGRKDQLWSWREEGE